MRTYKVGNFTYQTTEPPLKLIPHKTQDGQYLYYTVEEPDDGKNHSDIKSSAFTKR
jgi:hypothetical protein